MAELPEGWEAKRFDGRIVYVNHMTQRTQWKKPTGFAPSHNALEDTDFESRTATTSPHVAEVKWRGRSPSPIPSNGNNKHGNLPSGWRKELLSNGQTLYVNFRDKATSWNPPAPTVAMTPAHGSGERLDNGRRPRDARSNTSSSPSNTLGTDPDGGLRTRRSNDGSDVARRGSTGHDVDRGKGESQRTREPDSPLPEGWREAHNESGKPYYRNDHEQMSRRDNPRATQASKPHHSHAGTGSGTNNRSGNRSSAGRNEIDPDRRSGTTGPRCDSLADRSSSSQVGNCDVGRTERVKGQRVREPGSPVPDGESQPHVKSVKVYYRNDHEKMTRRQKPSGTQEHRSHRGRSKTPTDSADLHYRTNYEQTVSWDKLMGSDDFRSRHSGDVTENSITANSSDSGRRGDCRSGAARGGEYPDENSRRRGTRGASRADTSTCTRCNPTTDPYERVQDQRMGEMGSPLAGGRTNTSTEKGKPYYRSNHHQITNWDNRSPTRKARRHRVDVVAGKSSGSSIARDGTGRQSRSRTREPRSRSGADRSGSNSDHRTGRRGSGNGERVIGPVSPLPEGTWSSSSSSGRGGRKTKGKDESNWYRRKASPGLGGGGPSSPHSHGRSMTSPEQEEYHRGVSNGSGGGRRSPMGRVDKGHRSTHPTAGTATRVSSSPLPPGWSEAYDYKGRLYYLNDYEKTTTWERPTEAARTMATPAPQLAAPAGSKSARRQSVVPTRTARRSSTDASREQRLVAAAGAAAPAPVALDPAMYGLPPGTQVPPQLQQAIMQQQAMMQAQIGGLHPGVPMTALHGAAANVRSEMMEGIGKMARTGFSSLPGFDCDPPTTPHRSSKRQEQGGVTSWMKEKASDVLAGTMESGVDAGLDYMGIGDFVKVKVDKKEGGGFKVRPKLKLFDFLGDDDDE